MNRVAETVRLEYDSVDNLVSNTKKVFIKAPLRVQVYKEMYHELFLSLEPILTRWGTWLKCVDFLATNFSEIKDVLSQFDSQSSAAIENCIENFRYPAIKRQLAYIKPNFVPIATAIEKLEKREL